MAKLKVLPKRLDILDVNDPSCSFRINIDVLNEAFGIKRSMFPRAVYPDWKDGYYPGNVPGEKVIIWMPKLYRNKSDWKNILSEDGTKLFEIAEPTRHEDWMEIHEQWEYTIRLIFVKPDPKSPYKFIGAFKPGRMDHLRHTYERIATRVRLIGDPVSSVELIDDIRC